MSKEVNKRLPELRFPEFESDGGWIEKPLIATADKNVKWSFTGGPFGSNLKASDYTDSGFRIIQLQNIGDGEFKDDYKIYTSIEKADELLSCNIYADDIIISKMGDPVGRACIIPKHLARCVMASDGIRLVVDEKKFSKYFIFSLINSKPIRKAIESKSTGTTRKRIGLNDLKQVKLTIPKNSKEQEKIANCLSSLDAVINAETEKLELQQNHKKGLLQQLFPQEGETQPKYRFPEFVNDGDWEEKRLIDFEELISGDGDWILSKNITNNGEYKIVQLSSIGFGTFKKKKLKTISKNTFVDLKGTPILKGDLLINRMVDSNNINNCIFPYSGNFVTSVDICWIRENSFINNYFFMNLLCTFTNQKKLLSLSSGAGRVRISKKNLFEKFVFSLPKNPKEQQKIAICLSEADNLLEAQTQKIKSLQDHKKGLLQQLFPKN